VDVPGLLLPDRVPAELVAAEPEVGADGGLDALRSAAARCTRCPLHAPATRTVFGEGAGAARLVLVGEQPGDRDALRGAQDVAPAGGRGGAVGATSG
jgi:uracil-DNA glycosylase